MAHRRKYGFTIIEVVLVLAIAGLIFIMAFIAFPALQRSQRDTQRRQDYADLSANIVGYMSNNEGSLPNDGKLEASKFVNKDGKTPEGLDYEIVVKTLSQNTEGTKIDISKAKTDTDRNNIKRTVYVYTSATCQGSTTGMSYSAPKGNGNSKSYAIYGYMESGTYCTSNSE